MKIRKTIKITKPVDVDCSGYVASLEVGDVLKIKDFDNYDSVRVFRPDDINVSAEFALSLIERRCAEYIEE